MTEESLYQSHSETELSGCNEFSESESGNANDSELRSGNNMASPKPQRSERAFSAKTR